VEFFDWIAAGGVVSVVGIAVLFAFGFPMAGVAFSLIGWLAFLIGALAFVDR